MKTSSLIMSWAMPVSPIAAMFLGERWVDGLGFGREVGWVGGWVGGLGIGRENLSDLGGYTVIKCGGL